MPRLTETDGLTDVQRDILAAVRAFVDAVRGAEAEVPV